MGICSVDEIAVSKGYFVIVHAALLKKSRSIAIAWVEGGVDKPIYLFALGSFYHWCKGSRKKGA